MNTEKPKSIIGFYIQAAEKMGAAGLSEMMKTASLEAHRESGINYKLDYLIGEDGDCFTVYGSGEFYCQIGKKTIEGKLPAPHAKSWVGKLVRNGVALEFARSHWGNYYGFRHGLRGEP